MYHLADNSCSIASATSPISFSCSSDGQLTIYQGLTCDASTQVEKWSVTTKKGPLNSSVAGNITASVITISSGAQTLGWVMSQPISLLLPKYKNAMEAIALFGYVVALASFSFVLSWGVYQYYKKRQPAYSVLIMNQLLWICSISSLMVSFVLNTLLTLYA